MNTASLKKNLKRTNLTTEQLGEQIRISCEHVDALVRKAGSLPGQKLGALSEGFEELFTLLEEFRLSEEELRMKHHQLASLNELLETERERYRELFEVAPDAYIVTDPKATIEESNPAASRMFQVSQKDLIGMSLFLFVPAEHHAYFRDQLNQLHKGEGIKGLELPVTPRDGKVIVASLTLSTVHSSQNDLVGLHCMIRDITEKKRTEDALKLSEERFRSIAQSAKDAIIVADGEGNMLSWNRSAQQMFGYTEEEALGSPLLMLMPKDCKGQPWEALERYRKTGEVSDLGKTMELQGLRKDESEFPIEISLSGWGSGDQVYFSSIIRDVTERKQAEETRARLLERLILAQEEERRYIARELHDEAGQSLTSLLVGIRMIEESRTLQKAKVEASRLRQIAVQTLDDLGRLARGLHPNVLDDLGLIVALNRYAPDYARSFGIKVKFESVGLGSDRLPLAVEMALFRIAQEALTNVAKHAAAKNIQITVNRESQKVQLILKDDGKGFHVEKALQNAAASNCLGLYGMRERASLLGGSVSIESDSGKGTTVNATIPLSENGETSVGLSRS